MMMMMTTVMMTMVIGCNYIINCCIQHKSIFAIEPPVLLYRCHRFHYFLFLLLNSGKILRYDATLGNLLTAVGCPLPCHCVWHSIHSQKFMFLLNSLNLFCNSLENKVNKAENKFQEFRLFLNYGFTSELIISLDLFRPQLSKTIRIYLKIIIIIIVVAIVVVVIVVVVVAPIKWFERIRPSFSSGFDEILDFTGNKAVHWVMNQCGF